MSKRKLYSHYIEIILNTINIFIFLLVKEKKRATKYSHRIKIQCTGGAGV
jgi:hypothetical protein